MSTHPMLKVGQYNRLTAVRLMDFGVLLDAGEYGNILLPKRYAPAAVQVADEMDVFVYRDSEDELIATTETPKVTVGQCAHLKVVDINDQGAFLDWGLPKDLLVPYGEQQQPMQLDRSYVVTVFLDPHSERLVASSRLSRQLAETAHYFKPGQAVELLVCGRSEMGYKTVINHTHLGLLFRDEAFKPLKYGARVAGYIKGIRADGKIDVSLQLPAAQQRAELTEQIIRHLQDNDGQSTLTDHSAPDDIYQHYNVSKKAYKKALGSLYKAQRIVIEAERIRLLD